MSAKKKESEYLTKSEIASLGKIDKRNARVTLEQAKRLMEILGIKEIPETKTYGACKHFAVTKCAVNAGTVMANASDCGLYVIVRTSKNRLVRQLTKPFIGCAFRCECELTGQSCPYCEYGGLDNAPPVCRLPKDKCVLPWYAYDHPEKRIPDEALDIICRLVDCTGCDCLGKHWYLDECSGCGNQAAHLKARYLAKCYSDRKRKEKQQCS
jgi:hypothetical protein